MVALTGCYNDSQEWSTTSGSFSINNGSVGTTSTTVSLSINLPPSATQMYISNGNGCGFGGSWQTASSSVTWSLATIFEGVSTANPGLFTIKIKFKDKDGIETKCVSSSIFYDPIDPQPMNVNATSSDWTTLTSFPYGSPVCSGTEPSYYCIPAAEVRQVQIHVTNTCEGLEMVDELGAFNWTCSTQYNANPTFYSKLKIGKGIRDLIGIDGQGNPYWLANSVTVKRTNRALVTSTKKVWYTTPLVLLPDNSAQVSGSATLLSSPHTIYVLPTSRSTHGYILTGVGSSLVTLRGAVLSWNNSGYNVDPGTGTVGALTSRTLVSVSTGAYFNTIEGTFNAASVATGLLFVNSKMPQVRATEVFGSQDGANIFIKGSTAGRFEGIRSAGAKNGDGIAFSFSSNDNLLLNSNSSNNERHGVNVLGSGQVVVKNLLAASNGVYGVIFDSSSLCSLITSTLTGSGDSGLKIASSNSIIVHNLLSTSNINNGIFIDSVTSGSNFSQLALLGNGVPLVMTSTSSNNFNGMFLFNGGCNVASGISGLQAGNSCAPSAGSTHTALNVNGSFPFVGTVTDSMNGSGSGSVSDWFSFQNAFRTWGPNIAAFFTSAANATCQGVSCHIWDWSLRAGSVPANSTYDGVNTGTKFISNGPCPSDANRSTSGSIYSFYLQDAVEASSFPNEGNGNGVCESWETCVYTPNFGVYQGHGEGATCLYDSTAASITNVTMRGFTENGR
jgi:hypothetical protein